MKTIFIITLSCMIFNSCAQETIRGNGKMTKETRNVGSDFNAVESAGAFDVRILEGKQDGKIQLEGESNILEKIDVELQGSTLVLKQKPGYNFRNTKNILISFKAEKLNAIGLSGSGTVTTEGVQRSENLKVGLSGSGDMDIKAVTENLNAGISGSGNISLVGKTDNFKIGISGSGDVNAYEFKSRNVEVGISGSGNSEVYVDGNLQASVAGSGDIFYKGNPENINAKSGGSGDVIDAN